MIKNNMIWKGIGVGIILLFVGTAIVPAIAQTTEKQSVSRGNWLYVGGTGPGNYTKIQDAINASSNGDTIYVHKKIYYEHILIAKDINLLGEYKEQTIIDAQGTGTAVQIGGYVNFSGFTIRNAEVGVNNYYSPSSDDVYIFFLYGNIITNNIVGIGLSGSFHNVIYGNIITQNQFGINFFNADDYEVKNNNFIDNEKHAYFEYVLFVQFMPRIKWDGNYWDDWNLRLPRPIKGEKVIIFVFRPGTAFKKTVCSWYNIDWHPAKEPYGMY
ncbi:MAG: NosD domain-containing protein [Thermoplasmatota archaeon]